MLKLLLPIDCLRNQIKPLIINQSMTPMERGKRLRVRPTLMLRHPRRNVRRHSNIKRAAFPRCHDVNEAKAHGGSFASWITHLSQRRMKFADAKGCVMTEMGGKPSSLSTVITPCPPHASSQGNPHPQPPTTPPQLHHPVIARLDSAIHGA